METEQLKTLWHLAFGDSYDFIDLFFSTAYAPGRCRFLAEAGRLTAALYWLDCEYQGQKLAYIYAVATHPYHRGRGLCRKLMADTHNALKQQGYAGALLMPAEAGLRKMYANMGYRNCTRVSEFSCTAGTPVPLRKICPEEFAWLRRKYLPENGVIQEGDSIAYLASYSDFYAGADFLLAGTPQGAQFHGIELLGNRDAAPGILAALGCEAGSFRCPGGEIPFAMFLPLADTVEVPGYLGLAFD